MDVEPTIDDLRAEANKSPVSRLHFDILMWRFNPPSYSAWVSRVEDALLYEVGLMTERRHDLHDLDEDALSAILNISLQNLNLDAGAKFVNGNTDITVQYNSYKWLGEAKFGADVGKVLKGYLQLTTRYTTGMDGQSSGGMLIYCPHGSAKTALAGWRAALQHEFPDCNARDGSSDLIFRSEDTCMATDAKLDIVHIAVPLFHNPQDPVRKISPAAVAAARAARAKVRAEDGDDSVEDDSD